VRRAAGLETDAVANRDGLAGCRASGQGCRTAMPGTERDQPRAACASGWELRAQRMRRGVGNAQTLVSVSVRLVFSIAGNTLATSPCIATRETQNVPPLRERERFEKGGGERAAGVGRCAPTQSVVRGMFCFFRVCANSQHAQQRTATAGRGCPCGRCRSGAFRAHNSRRASTVHPASSLDKTEACSPRDRTGGQGRTTKGIPPAPGHPHRSQPARRAATRHGGGRVLVGVLPVHTYRERHILPQYHYTRSI